MALVGVVWRAARSALSRLQRQLRRRDAAASVKAALVGVAWRAARSALSRLQRQRRRRDPHTAPAATSVTMALVGVV
jgi:hypothetical protein